MQLGNWNEDIARQEVAAKDYEVRRAGGELLYLRKRRELNFLSQAVPHAFHADGLVRFGDSVMLATAASEDPAARRFLCSNIFSAIAPGASRVTAGAAAAPAARNVHVLMRPPAAAGGGGGGSGAASKLSLIHI